jgi:hypothetical protein
MMDKVVDDATLTLILYHTSEAYPVLGQELCIKCTFFLKAERVATRDHLDFS